MAHHYAFNRTTFHMIKSTFGPAVRSKKWEAQVNEVLLTVLCHNVVVLVHSTYELGLQSTSWKGAASPASSH